MPKVILEGHIIVPAADLEAVKKELVNHISLTRQESGCLIFRVDEDSDNPHRFNVYEEYVDRQAFSFHQQRVKDSKWGSISINAERHYKVTDVAD